MTLEARPAGRKNSKLEFIAKSGDQNLYIEVKSPYRKRPPQLRSGNDSDLIESSLRQANEQFDKGQCNVLVLVPSLRTTVYSRRKQLITAFYGEEKFVFDIDVEKGCATGPVETKFFPEGRFLKQWKNETAPRYKRVSAVITIEEKLREEKHDVWFDHNILVLYNPHAEVPCGEINWGNAPQFRQDGNHMKWTDGKRLLS